MSETIIDVVITVFNGAETIQSSVESIQHQTIKNIKIIVVDDGSTDNTLKILHKMVETDSRLQVISKPHSGIVESINLGLAHCTSEFIARFDADDISYPRRFETQIAYLKGNENCIAVSSYYIRIDEDNQQLGLKRMPPPVEIADPTWVPCREPFLMQTFLMVRKSVLDKVNGYRLCEVSEDSDLYWRLHEIGYMHNIEEVLGAYRLNPNSISSKSIVNGRRMALWSQLVGISALRRKNFDPDITFDHERLNSFKSATKLEEFCSIGSKGLSESESARLRISASVKLLQFASYRPFELDVEDCRFIRKSVIEGDVFLNHENRKLVKNDILNSGSRLIFSGKYHEAYALLKYLIPYAILISLLRKFIPQFIRNFIKSIVSRDIKSQFRKKLNE